jgi:hypothetical protein
VTISKQLSLPFRCTSALMAVAEINEIVPRALVSWTRWCRMNEFAQYIEQQATSTKKKKQAAFFFFFSPALKCSSSIAGCLYCLPIYLGTLKVWQDSMWEAKPTLVEFSVSLFVLLFFRCERKNKARGQQWSGFRITQTSFIE